MPLTNWSPQSVSKLNITFHTQFSLLSTTGNSYTRKLLQETVTSSVPMWSHSSDTCGGWGPILGARNSVQISLWWTGTLLEPLPLHVWVCVSRKLFSESRLRNGTLVVCMWDMVFFADILATRTNVLLWQIYLKVTCTAINLPAWFCIIFASLSFMLYQWVPAQMFIYVTSTDTCLLDCGSWLQVLLVQPLECCSHWFPATHVGDLHWIPRYQLHI